MRAALGLAPRAVASLPIASPADDRRAWSDYGGMWHVVDVRYRGRGPLGLALWGRGAGARAQPIPKALRLAMQADCKRVCAAEPKGEQQAR